MRSFIPLIKQAQGLIVVLLSIFVVTTCHSLHAAEMKCLLSCTTLAKCARAFVETVRLCKLGEKVSAVAKTQSHPIRYHLPCLVLKTIGSLRMRVFEARTATGRKHFACQDSVVSQIFILIISKGEKIRGNVNVVL